MTVISIAVCLVFDLVIHICISIHTGIYLYISTEYICTVANGPPSLWVLGRRRLEEQLSRYVQLLQARAARACCVLGRPKGPDNYKDPKVYGM